MKFSPRKLLSRLFNSKSICDPYRKFLENSIYIVPPNTLLAYQYLNGQNIKLTDQTVWIINKYDKGYFFGKAYVSLNSTATSELNISGTIAFNGEVYITFFPENESSKDTDIVKGIGKIYLTSDNQAFFIMQMNSAQNSLSGLSHWSYMIPVTPNDFFYQHLPSLNISVPNFISQFS